MRLLRSQHLAHVQNPQAYILRTAGNVIAEWNARTLPQDPLTVADEMFLITHNDAEDALDAREAQHRLDLVLASAPPAMRAVLLLRFRDDCSQKEIAEKLGMTGRQVKRHLIKGYEYMRLSFKDPEWSQPP